MDLQLPVVPIVTQQKIASTAARARLIGSLAQSISTIVEIYVGQLADALGSGAVTVNVPADD